MQLDIFSAAAPEAAELRKTALPELLEAVARVGTPAQWQTRTLSQVLVLWEELYEEFIAVLDGPIQHARSFCKEHELQNGKGGPLARKFYQREVERLVRGQLQLRATIENLYCDNLLAVFELGKAVLRTSRLNEEEVEESGEFFNEVIQRPASADLPKLLPVLMQDLAQEYLRLQNS